MPPPMVNEPLPFVSEIQQAFAQLPFAPDAFASQLTPEVLLSVLLGVAISSACGFRVFMPPLVLCAGALFFNAPAPAGLEWLVSYPALLALLTAALVEMAAYYLPWVDNLLDAAATPLSVLAGTVISGSFFGAAFGSEVSPLVQWSFALMAGGGAAGAVSALTTGSRLTSSALTFGLANPIVATLENTMALAVPVLSLIFPTIAIIAGLVGLVLVLGALAVVLLGILFKRRHNSRHTTRHQRSVAPPAVPPTVPPAPTHHSA